MSSASGSGCPHVVGESQDRNPDQSATLGNGALSATGDSNVGAGSVKEEPAVRPRWSLPFVVPSSNAPNPVSYKVVHGGPPIELRMVGHHLVEPSPISHEWSAWYEPHVRRPTLSRSVSVGVNPPSVGLTSRNVSVGRDDWEQLPDQFDDILVQSDGYPSNGRPLLPPSTPLYNKFDGGMPHAGLGCLNYEPISLRNIRVGRPAVALGLHIGEVVRFGTRTFI